MSTETFPKPSSINDNESTPENFTGNESEIIAREAEQLHGVPRTRDDELSRWEMLHGLKEVPHTETTIEQATLPNNPESSDTPESAVDVTAQDAALDEVFTLLNKTSVETTANKRSRARKISRKIIDFMGYEEETGGFTRGDGYLTKEKRAARKAAKAAREAEAFDEPEYEEYDDTTDEFEAERPRLRERISDRIQRGKEALKRKFSRQDAYKLERLHKKAAKLEAKTTRLYEKADPIQGKIDAEEAAYAEMIDEAHEEALEMDKYHIPGMSEAYEMNEAFDAAALREAKIKERQDAIDARADAKNNKQLDKSLRKINRNDEKRDAKKAKIEAKIDRGSISDRTRARLARTLNAINRQY